MKSLRTNFWVDAFAFAAFLAMLQPRMTGISIHEWLGLATAATLVLHVVLHWDWAVGVTRAFLKNLFHASRFNYLVDALAFVAFTLTMTSGLAISRVVLPAFGLQMLSSRSWVELHNTSANLTLLLVALHFALHWSWLANTFQRLLVAPFRGRNVPARSQPEALRTPVKAQ